MYKRIYLRSSTTIALAGATALVISGCGFDGGSGGSSGDERISIAMMQPPTAAYHPFSDDIGKISRLSTGETLVGLDEEVQVEPHLATEWEQADDLTWVFTLREGVTYHDGNDLNAETVKNSLDFAEEADTRPRALGGVSISTEVTGDYEITITTESTDPLLPNRLASAQMSMFSPEAYDDDGTVTPVGTGTGPFELTEASGNTTATLERFDDYWGDDAQLAGIDVSYVTDGSARAGSIRSGESDVAESIPVSQVSLLDPEHVHEVQMPRSTYLALNAESGPFADPEVRAAARAAIDPAGIVDNVYEGQADEASGLLGPAIPWAEELRGDVDSDTDAADVDGVEIVLATYSDRSENAEIAVQLENQLEAAGFVVTQDIREYSNMEGEMLDSGFDATIMSRNTLLDTGDPISFFSQDFTCDGGFNIAHLCDEEFDRIVDQGLMKDAGEERQQATMEIETALMQLDVVVPLVYESVVQAEAGTFTDIERDPLERRLITEYTHAAE